MMGWVLGITKMIPEALREKLVMQVFWRWPKKLISSVTEKSSTERDQALVIGTGSPSPLSERSTDPATPAAVGPQHDASNYMLRRVGGAYVYEFHAELEDGHDSCWACQKCFDDGKVSLLQPNSWTVELYEDLLEWICTECDRSYLINQSESPPEW